MNVVSCERNYCFEDQGAIQGTVIKGTFLRGLLTAGHLGNDKSCDKRHVNNQL